MSFKRTSCVSSAENSLSEATCNVQPRHVQETTGIQPVDDRNSDVAVCSLHVSTSPADRNMLFPTLISASTAPESSSFEPTFVTVQEVLPQQEVELIGRHVNSFVARDNDIAQLLCPESGSALLDLQSEKICDTEVWKEIGLEKIVIPCKKCLELKQIISKNEAEITELRKRLDDLTLKHTRFIVSNCNLNEENDHLKMENDQLKLELSTAKYTNSQLHFEKEDLQRKLDVRTNQQLENNRTGGSSSCLVSSDPGRPGQANTGETYPYTVRDDLQEAISMSQEQQSYLTKLQEQIASQNQIIKTLCAQLQRSNDGYRKPADVRHHPKELVVTMSDLEQPPGKVTKERIPDGFIPGHIGKIPGILGAQDIVEDYGAMLSGYIKDDEDIYSRGAVNFPHPLIRLQTKPEPKISFAPSFSTSDTQIKAAEKSGSEMKNNIELSVAKPQQEVAASFESTSLRVKGPQNLPSQREVVSCPICYQEFPGGNKELYQTFRKHLDDCLEEKQCPMCFKKFTKSVSQSDFEEHVNQHFTSAPLDFEVLRP